jgi:hypothetical protein
MTAMLAIVQAFAFLQLIERTEASFVSDYRRALPFSNHQRRFQRVREAKGNVSVRNSAAPDETNGEASVFTSYPPYTWSDPTVTTTASSSTGISLREHEQPQPDHSSTQPPPHFNSQYLDGATLGDIMSDGVGLQMTSHSSSSGTTTNPSTDSTSTTSLAEQYGIQHPLDRMALTANGNLQRLVSSYYDAPVSVVVDSCILRVTNNGSTNTATATTSSSVPASASTLTMPKTWDRTVHLTVFDGQTFCTAVSVITVHDPLCQQLVQSGQVGLGQLFRYLDLLPEFTLREAGVGEGKGSGGGAGGGFWRDYTLSCAELTCDIHEAFRPGLWDMQPHPNNEIQNEPDSSASAST